MGAIAGIIVGIAMCVQAFNGELEPWSLGIALIAVLVGIIFPITVGTFLTGVVIASPLAAILGFISGNTHSALAALGIGVIAFAGQFIVGHIRRDRSGIGQY